MKIPLKMLRDKKACKDQLALFEQHFGQGVEVTLEAALEVASIFDWDWAARKLLSPASRKSYDLAKAPALEAYDLAKAPAWRAYHLAIASAWFAGWEKDHALTPAE